MEIVQIPEKPSWTTYIVALKVGESLKAPLSKRSTIAPRISGTIKFMHPERVYCTDATSEPGLLIVTRTA